MVRAPAPTVDNAVLRSQTRRQATGSKTLRLVRLVPVNLQSPRICSKCHLFWGTVLPISTTTTGPFVPASRDTNKQRPRLLQAPPPIPTHRPGQTQASLPNQGPQFVLSRTHACTPRVVQGGFPTYQPI